MIFILHRLRPTTNRILASSKLSEIRPATEDNSTLHEFLRFRILTPQASGHGSLGEEVRIGRVGIAHVPHEQRRHERRCRFCAERLYTQFVHAPVGGHKRL